MQQVAFELDGGNGWRAKLGLILLQTDETLEMDMRQFINHDGVTLHHSRIPSAPEVTSATLAAMQHDLVTAAGLLPPAIDFDVIGYGCTSAAAVLGENKIAELIRQAQPGAEVTNPATAAIRQLQTHGAKKVAVLTPYIEDVSRTVCETLEHGGLEVVALASFNERSDNRVARISEQSIYDGIIACHGLAECDAVFVSCTNLRVAGVYKRAEKVLGKLVTCSNRALAWDMLRLAGIN